jgi:hypothetical protein
LGVAVAQGIYVLACLCLQKLGMMATPSGPWFWKYTVAGLGAVLLWLPYAMIMVNTESDLFFTAGGEIHHDFHAVCAEFGFHRYWFFLLAIIGLLAILLKPTQHRLLLPVMLAVAGPISYYLMKHSFFHIRYVVFLLPFFILLAAHGMEISTRLLTSGASLRPLKKARLGRFFSLGKVSSTQFQQVLACIALSGMFIIVLMADLPLLRRLYNIERDDGDWQSAAALVNQEFRNGDAVFGCYRYIANFAVYCNLPIHGVDVQEGFETNPTFQPAPENVWTGNRWITVQFDLQRKRENEIALAKYLKSQNVRRVWVVWPNDYQGRTSLVSALESGRTELTMAAFKNIRVSLFVPN